ncbi:hypothetical protein [Tautonia sociabilis]|uniref:Uncharacterized protein n=1 Tax=Tautonia sociabilis TaxID=2080755 RepID=A0A432MGY6_9BACT|nr:hypothetical protein [Tautonia sociabilis]RUL86209.1 hypothetical protein TsocGM_16750 [Tautonia sociabilis]
MNDATLKDRVDDDLVFEELDRALAEGGPIAAADRLIARLDSGDDPRALLDALLLKARLELGLPALPPSGLSGLPEPQRSRYEDRYIEALRAVGRKRLEAGDILGCWPYFRAIGEKEPVAEAIEAVDPAATDAQVLGNLMELALQHGVNPRRGFELVLESYGPCSAITAFEQLPPDEEIRAPCADRLVRHLHDQLRYSLRVEISRSGRPEPPESASIPELLEGNDWLFDDDSYHIDTSHLAAVVRMSPLLRDPETIRLAVSLTEYGRRLSDRHRYEGDPPFELLYEDHAIYLRALLGEDEDAAVAHFRAKLSAPGSHGNDLAATLPAQILVRLLDRLGRREEAIPLAAEHLRGVPETMLLCPGLVQLCREADRPDLLARFARSGGDLVSYAAAIAQRSHGGG